MCKYSKVIVQGFLESALHHNIFRKKKNNFVLLAIDVNYYEEKKIDIRIESKILIQIAGFLLENRVGRVCIPFSRSWYLTVLGC